MIRLKKRIVKSKKSLILLFVNRFIRAGKKDFIYKNFILSLIRIKVKLNINFNVILNKLLNNIIPVINLKPKFASGVIYLIPTFIKFDKSVTIGLSWFVKAVKSRREYSFKHRLLFEIRDIFNQKGLTLSYKKDYYKLALLNRSLLFKFRNK